MKKNRFMRLIVFFDIPNTSKIQQRAYRVFSKFLKTEGYIMIQYSVYSKLCINSDAAVTASKRLISNHPPEGDIRYMIITERQYQNIVSIQGKYSLQERVTTTDRTIMIGGMNDENDKK